MKNFFFLIGGFLLAWCISLRYDVQQVSGNSMNPTFCDKDIILVELNAIPKDSDVIVFTTSYIENYEVDGEHAIKRYYEKYSTNGLYVMGDNAAVSYDSRYYGEIPKEACEGVVLCNITQYINNLFR